MGLFQHDPGVSDGYVLVSPLNSTTTYLINNDGHEVHRWETNQLIGTMAYLLPDGNLLRSSRVPSDSNFSGNNGGHGRLQEYDWDGTLVWSYDINDPLNYSHHDFVRLPNGNTLFIVWVYKTAAEAIQAGRNPLTVGGSLWPDKITEVQKTGLMTGTVVWEWHVWDHLIQDFDPTKDNYGVVADNPRKININQPTSFPEDWTHLNGIAYNPIYDQIIMSVREFNEFWIIDHSTTTAEAAGSTGGTYGFGGDLLYRWGNPQAYGRGTATDQILEHQHDSHWITAGLPEDGNIILFNNGTTRGFSSADEIALPINLFGVFDDPGSGAWGPPAPTWTYLGTDPAKVVSPIISGADRLPNGNTLVIAGVQGRLLETTPGGMEVWEYVNPIGTGGAPLTQGTTPAPQGISSEVGVFKARKYPIEYPAFTGRSLDPIGPLEVFAAPDPVPDGAGATAPFTVSKTGVAGEIEVQWDSTSCQAAIDYNLLYGQLPNVQDYTIDGAVCALGTTGDSTWSTPPAGDLFFLIVGTDATGLYESSWGVDSAGVHRNATTSSFQCGVTTKDNRPTCP